MDDMNYSGMYYKQKKRSMRLKKIALFLIPILLIFGFFGVKALLGNSTNLEAFGKVDSGGAHSNATSLSFTQRFISGSLPISQYTTTSYSGRLGVLELYAVSAINLSSHTNLQEVVRGGSSAGEDDLGLVPNNKNFTARIFANQTNFLGIPSINVSISLNGTLIGGVLSNSSGEATVVYDTSNYPAVVQQIFANYTTNDYMPIQNLSSVNVSIVYYSIPNFAGNKGVANQYVNGQIAILYFNITKTNASGTTFYDPQNISVNVTDSSATVHYPDSEFVAGNRIKKNAVGQYESRVVINSSIDGTVRWEIRVSDDNFSNYIGSARHNDVGVVAGPVCGNTITETPEACDDGNLANGDGCSSSCETEGGGGGSCFPAGTKILMADGSYENIEDVKVGDLVRSYDESSGKIVNSLVLELESPIRDHMCQIVFNNDVKLNLTNEHPVYTKQGWKSINPSETAKENSALLTQKLEVGDEVLFADNRYEEIIKVECWSETSKTYNLKSIQNSNTFFAENVLVHNKGDDGGGDTCKTECSLGEQDVTCLTDQVLRIRNCGNYDSDDCYEMGGDNFVTCVTGETCQVISGVSQCAPGACVENWQCSEWSGCFEGDLGYTPGGGITGGAISNINSIGITGNAVNAVSEQDGTTSSLLSIIDKIKSMFTTVGYSVEGLFDNFGAITADAVACIDGETQCLPTNENKYQVCDEIIKKNSVTYKWITKSCNTGLVCAGDGECQCSLRNACDSEGAQRCVGYYAGQVCKKSSSGCLTWEYLPKCSNGEVCAEGECISGVTTDAEVCTLGDLTCVGNVPRECIADKTKPNYWKSLSKCSSTETCIDGSCVIQHCFNNIKDYDETEVDCGGNSCEVCPIAPPIPEEVCGNNIIETGEECDDGNLIGGDGCSESCLIEISSGNNTLQQQICGNNIIETGEECDDGNLANGDGCSSTCRLEQNIPPQNDSSLGNETVVGNETSSNGTSGVTGNATGTEGTIGGGGSGGGGGGGSTSSSESFEISYGSSRSISVNRGDRIEVTYVEDKGSSAFIRLRYVSTSRSISARESHTLSVNKVGEGRISVTISSTPITQEIQIGGTTTFDIYGSGNDYVQTRTCIDNAQCGTENNKPLESQLCEELCEEDWQCEYTLCVQNDTESYPYNCFDLNACETIDALPTEPVSCDERPKCVPIEGGKLCPDWECTKWSECSADYSVSDALKGKSSVNGAQYRDCVDLNKVESPKQEKKICNLGIPIEAVKTEWCEETYVEIYNRETKKLVSRVKETEITPEFKRVDVSFIATDFGGYCSYCYDGVKDFDETGIDCGGPNCSACVDEYNYFNWLFWLLVTLALLEFLLLILLIYYKRKKEKKKLKEITKGLYKTTEAEKRFEKEAERGAKKAWRFADLEIRPRLLISALADYYRGGRIRRAERRRYRESERAERVRYEESKSRREERRVIIERRKGGKKYVSLFGDLWRKLRFWQRTGHRRTPPLESELVGVEHRISGKPLEPTLHKKLKEWKHEGYIGTPRLFRRLRVFNKGKEDRHLEKKLKRLRKIKAREERLKARQERIKRRKLEGLAKKSRSSGLFNKLKSWKKEGYSGTPRLEKRIGRKVKVERMHHKLLKKTPQNNRGKVSESEKIKMWKKQGYSGAGELERKLKKSRRKI